MVYIRWKEIFLELTVTTEVSVEEVSDVTQHPMEFGSNVADNLVNKNKRYRFKGMVSNISSYLITMPESEEDDATFSGDLKPRQKRVTDYFADLERVRKARDLVTFYFDPQLDNDGISNCVITRINYRRQPDHGNAYLVDIELEQVRVSERANTFEEREQTDPNLTSGETEGASTSTKEPDPP